MLKKATCTIICVKSPSDGYNIQNMNEIFSFGTLLLSSIKL